MDYAISNWILETFGSSKVFAVICRLVTYLGSTGTIILALVALLAFKRTRRLGIYSTLAVLFALIINNVILKNVIERARPFETYPEMTKMCELAGYKLPNGWSMASGHATISMCLAVSIFCFSKKWGVLVIVLSVLIGLTRVLLLVHYASDVLVGWAIGAVLAVGVYFVIKLIEIKYILPKIQAKNTKK